MMHSLNLSVSVELARKKHYRTSLVLFFTRKHTFCHCAVWTNSKINAIIISAVHIFATTFGRFYSDGLKCNGKCILIYISAFVMAASEFATKPLLKTGHLSTEELQVSPLLCMDPFTVWRRYCTIYSLEYISADSHTLGVHAAHVLRKQMSKQLDLRARVRQQIFDLSNSELVLVAKYAKSGWLVVWDGKKKTSVAPLCRSGLVLKLCILSFAISLGQKLDRLSTGYRGFHCEVLCRGVIAPVAKAKEWGSGWMKWSYFAAFCSGRRCWEGWLYWQCIVVLITTSWVYSENIRFNFFSSIDHISRAECTSALSVILRFWLVRGATSLGIGFEMLLRGLCAKQPSTYWGFYVLKTTGSPICLTHGVTVFWRKCRFFQKIVWKKIW